MLRHRSLNFAVKKWYDGAQERDEVIELREIGGVYGSLIDQLFETEDINERYGSVVKLNHGYPSIGDVDAD